MGRTTAGTKAAIAALVAGKGQGFQQLLKQLLQHTNYTKRWFLSRFYTTLGTLQNSKFRFLH
jgi:hypothetical protein